MADWLTVKAAAEALGVSERTVWRRLSSGALEADRSGSRTLVLVEVPDADSDAGVPRVAELARLEAEVERLEAVLAEVRGTLEDTRSERDEWRVAFAEYMRQVDGFLLEAGEVVEAEPEEERGGGLLHWLWRALGLRDR